MQPLVFLALTTLAATLPARAQMPMADPASMPKAAPLAMPMAEPPAVAPSCPADAEPIPAALAGWTKRKPLAAATDTASLGSGWLAPGIAVDLQLVATPEVAYVKRPDHPGGAVSFGGMVAFHTDHAGPVRVAIGSGAWIDMIDGAGNSVTSSAHGHGPKCSGIRKMVDFALKPGAYTIEIAGNGATMLPLIVAPLE